MPSRFLLTVSRSVACAVVYGAALLLSACGGGGGSSSTTAGTASPTTPTSAASSPAPTSTASSPTPATTNNVATVSIRQLESNTTTLTVNSPYISVTICDASGNCQTVPDVLVDTGSAGLRLFANKVSLNLPAIQAGSGELAACAQFASGYAWGSMRSATVKIAGESTTTAIPIQLMSDPSLPAAPSQCSAQGANFASGFAGIANGILGISNFSRDCGSACTTSTRPGVYYACSGSSCSPSTAALAQQGTNPIIAFAVDNNGSTLDLPPVDPGGALSVNGTLTFGVGTQADNAPPSTAARFPVDQSGNFIIAVNGQTGYGFVDSGSNGTYLDLAGVPQCSSVAGFYCPTIPFSLSIMTAGYQGTPTKTQPVTIGNAETMFSSGYTALPALGGTAAITNFVDLGLPFFYGRPITTGIEGTDPAAPYGYWAY